MNKPHKNNNLRFTKIKNLVTVVGLNISKSSNGNSHVEDIPIVSMGMLETPIGSADVAETLVSSVGMADTPAGSADVVEETSEPVSKN